MAAARNQEFVVEDTDGPVPRRVAAALEPRFTVIQERRRSARQTWLDTFDWRLHAAGLVLHQITDDRVSEWERQRANGRTGELVLRTAAGEPVASAAVSAPHWPGLLDVIPAGPLRDRLEPVVGVRALLPLARAQDKQTLLRVLDGEHKTVARITLDAATVLSPAGLSPAGLSPAGPPAPAEVLALPVRLLLAPVRGYQVDADRAGRLLAEAGGFAPAQSQAYESVLAAAGRRPGDYTDKVDLSLAASMPARVALARVLLRLAETIAANAGFVVRDVDIEFLHDLRVAVRRTRSALKLAGDALPGELAACYLPEFKWLGDLTTPTRDLDVYLAGFGQMAAGLRAASPGDLEPLRGYLMARRAAEQRVLLRGLRSERFSRLMTSWRAALEDAALEDAALEDAVLEGRPAHHDTGGRDVAGRDIAGRDIAGRDIAGRDIAGRDIAGRDIGSLAAERIARAYRRVIKRGAAVTSTSSTPEVHALRKRGKELRYLLEFFGSLYQPAAHRRAVKDLKGLQECLGEFQDGAVQREAIRQFGEEMVTRHDLPPAELTTTLLAMGELTAGLDERQRRTRAEVARRFGAFARAGMLRTLGVPVS